MTVGVLQRVWTLSCRGCGETVSLGDTLLLKQLAIRELRLRGWRETEMVWRCPPCHHHAFERPCSCLDTYPPSILTCEVHASAAARLAETHAKVTT